ncbi:unnamed protein product, partial [Discosporangium mesarthrocarpum]
PGSCSGPEIRGDIEAEVKHGTMSIEAWGARGCSLVGCTPPSLVDDTMVSRSTPEQPPLGPGATFLAHGVQELGHAFLAGGDTRLENGEKEEGDGGMGSSSMLLDGVG